ncbi:MAG TPA: VWA domain-containing protein [Cytophagales bacterium]|nr:VWA domain-containing protein [Cytophagales bacterium]
MTRTEIFTQSSPWYILLCLLVAALYAFLLYKKIPDWSKVFNYVLAGLRFLTVFIICFLLLAPVIKQIRNYIEKPIVLIAIDNSQSIANIHDKRFLNNLLQNLDIQAKKLRDEFEVEIESFSSTEIKNPDSVKFNHPVTNISSFLSGIQSKYENSNLAGVVFLTDGIFNQGTAPNYSPYNFTLFPLAIGDTIPKKDLNLKNVIYNKVAYRGNKFPIVLEITGEGFSNEMATVNLLKNGKVLDSKTITIAEDNINQTTFYTSSSEPGVQHYTVAVNPLRGEYSNKNNTGEVYIDIIDNKEKILMVALAPHPDVKAIKSALENKENYEFTLFIPGISAQPEDPKFDLVIFHQIPDIYNNALSVFNQFKTKSKNHLYILANQSNLNQFNASTSSVDIHPHGIQKDEVFPVFNKNFNKFTLTEDHQNTILKYPPIIVPFGDFQVPADFEVFLYQKVGTVSTDKPLIAVGSTENSKSGVIIGNGIWEWRLHEYYLNNSTVVFDEVVTKLVQYLSSKEDKRKFRVYPINNEIYDNEPVVFETEVYNNIYEKIYGQKINLEITDESGRAFKYSYINSKNNSTYDVGGLNAGIYKYTASTQLDGKKESVSGQFIIKELQLESLNTTANHAVLRELANNTGGKVFYPSQISSLTEELLKNKAKGKIHNSEENLELIHLKWLFFLLLILISIEWGLRKYHGVY